MVKALYAILVLAAAAVSYAGAVCSGNLKSYKCECSAWYSKGKPGKQYVNGSAALAESSLDKMFSILDHEYCAMTLECSNFTASCEQRCRVEVHKKLGTTVGDINSQVREALCDQYSPDQPLYYNGIRVYSFWKVDQCNSAYEPIVNDVCCNRKCSCKMLRQNVESSSREALDELEQFSMPAYKTFECARSDEDPCPQACRAEVARRLVNTQIQASSSQQLSLNVFNDKDTGRRMCQILGESVAAPGTDISVRVQSGPDDKVRTIRLGRLCCRKERACDCSLSIRGFNSENRLSGAPFNYPLIREDAPFEESYECSSHLADCMTRCREAALKFAAGSLQLTSDQLTKPIVELDPVGQYPNFARFICKQLQSLFTPNGVSDSDEATLLELVDANESGVFIYVMYNSYPKEFPFSEELYMGKICCDYAPDFGLVARTRCLN